MRRFLTTVAAAAALISVSGCATVALNGATVSQAEALATPAQSALRDASDRFVQTFEERHWASADDMGRSAKRMWGMLLNGLGAAEVAPDPAADYLTEVTAGRDDAPGAVAADIDAARSMVAGLNATAEQLVTGEAHPAGYAVDVRAVERAVLYARRAGGLFNQVSQRMDQPETVETKLAAYAAETERLSDIADALAERARASSRVG